MTHSDRRADAELVRRASSAIRKLFIMRDTDEPMPSFDDMTKAAVGAIERLTAPPAGGMVMTDDDEPKTWKELAEAAIADLRRYAHDEGPERRLVSANSYEERAAMLAAAPPAKAVEDTITIPREHIVEITDPTGRGYFTVRCNCGWESGFWVSYDNARSEAWQHNDAIKKHVLFAPPHRRTAMSDYTIQCSTCGAPDMMLCDCSLPEAPAPLDEARMRVRKAIDRLDAKTAVRQIAPLTFHELLETVDAAFIAMSRAISEARAEQRERIARMHDEARINAAHKMMECSKNGDDAGWACWQQIASAHFESAAAIRSQNDPDEQGE